MCDLFSLHKLIRAILGKVGVFALEISSRFTKRLPYLLKVTSCLGPTGHPIGSTLSAAILLALSAMEEASRNHYALFALVTLDTSIVRRQAIGGS